MDQATRQFVRERAENRCEYCRLSQEQAPFPVFHIEHILPRKHGGESGPENLCLSCSQCNLHKSSNLSGIDPVSGAVVPLFHPRKEFWPDHFLLNGPDIQGKTAIGRATVQVLNMNDEDRRRLRSDLIELGEWSD